MSFTPKQAQALLEWGKRNPKAVEAYSDASHPAHEEAVKWATRLMEISAGGAGRDDSKEPIFDADTFMARYYAKDPAIRERLDSVVAGDTAPAPLAAPLPEDDGLRELRGLSPEAAAEQIKRLQANPEFSKLLLNEKDPLIVDAWDLLNNLAGGDSSGMILNSSAPASGDPMRAAPAASANSAFARYEALEKTITADANHPYRNPQHPDHHAAVAERDAAFNAAIGEATSSGGTQQ